MLEIIEEYKVQKDILDLYNNYLKLQKILHHLY